MKGNITRSARAGDSTDEPIPADLESERAKLVYLAVRTYAPVEVGELKETLGMPGLALLPILGTLARKGHVERNGRAYTPS